MIRNKVTIDGKVISVGDWKETKNGDLLRDVCVQAEGSRLQHYLLTQFCGQDVKPWEIRIGESYKFEGYVNGLRHKTESGDVYVNKICISKIWRPA